MSGNEWLKQIPEGVYWLFVFFSSFIENIFPPYPGDTVIVFGGYLAGIGSIDLWSLALSVYLGSLAGALVMYYAGERILHFFADHARLKSLRKITGDENLDRVRGWFDRWGVLAVLFSRFSAGVRFFVAIVAGMLRMNIILFALVFSAATLLWNALLMYGGYVLGENWEVIKQYIRIYNTVVIIVLVVLLALFLAWKRKPGEPADAG